MPADNEIRIPDGTEWRETVSRTVCDAQVRIFAGDDSVATVEIIAGGDVEIVATVQSNAVVTIVCIQTEEASITQKAHLSTGATVHWQNVSLAPVRHSLSSHLEGKHAVSNVDWIFYAKDDERQEITARNVFTSGDGGGEITMKGVAEGKAHVLCNGMIDIGLHGGGTNTYLTEDVLMLDGSAKVDAIPGLEIKTNDVKASHSATVSKVTPADLFYFASRGIDETQARQMYVQGFLSDLTKNIADEEIRTHVCDAIERKYAAV